MQATFQLFVKGQFVASGKSQKTFQHSLRSSTVPHLTRKTLIATRRGHSRMYDKQTRERRCLSRAVLYFPALILKQLLRSISLIRSADTCLASKSMILKGWLRMEYSPPGILAGSE